MARDQYRMAARMYDLVAEPLESKARKVGIELLPPRDNMSVLDIGCGTGTQLALYRRNGCRLYGIDTSPAMLAKAQRKLGDGAELRLEDASSLDFPSQTFDLVSAFLVIHEMPSSLRSAVLADCKRVTKPDGRILVMDWHFGHYPFPMGYFWRFVRRYFEITAGRQHHALYCDFKRQGGLEPLIHAAGLSVDKQQVVRPYGTIAVYLLKS
jgi:ubiquinone/menaquinone biosynthesis C-methylase UbiE